MFIKNNSHIKNIFTLFKIKIIFCILILLHSCQTNDTKPNKNQSEDNEQVDSSGFRTENIKGIYEIEIASYLNATKFLSEETDVQFFNLEKGAYFIILNEEKTNTTEDFIEFGTELLEVENDTSYMAYYLQFQLDNLIDIIEEYDDVIIRDIEIAGINGKQYEVNGYNPEDEKRYRFIGTLLIKERQIFFMYAWFNEENAEILQDDFQHMINSFQLLEKSKPKI